MGLEGLFRGMEEVLVSTGLAQGLDKLCDTKSDFLGDTNVSDFCKLFIVLLGGGLQSLKASSLNVLDLETPLAGAALKGSVAHEAADPKGSLNGSSVFLAKGSSILLLNGSSGGFPKGSCVGLLNGSSLLLKERKYVRIIHIVLMISFYTHIQRGNLATKVLTVRLFTV